MKSNNKVSSIIKDFNDGKTRDAILQLTDLIKNNPNNLDYLFLYAKMCNQTNRLDDAEKTLSCAPGLAKACAKWANDHNIISWGTDQFATDPIPFEEPGLALPMHIEMLTKSGIRLMENVYMDEIVKDKVYEFCIMGLPLKIRGGTGSPLRLIALI